MNFLSLAPVSMGLVFHNPANEYNIPRLDRNNGYPHLVTLSQSLQRFKRLLSFLKLLEFRIKSLSWRPFEPKYGNRGKISSES